MWIILGCVGYGLVGTVIGWIGLEVEARRLAAVDQKLSPIGVISYFFIAVLCWPVMLGIGWMLLLGRCVAERMYRQCKELSRDAHK